MFSPNSNRSIAMRPSISTLPIAWLGGNHSLNLSRMFLLFLASTILMGCNYRLEGTNPVLPREATTIAILPIRNQTFQAGLETRLMRAMRELLRNNSSVELTNESDADLILNISLASLTTKRTSVSADGLTVELQLTLEGAVELSGEGKPKRIWREGALLAKGTLNFEKGEESRGVTTSTLNRGMDQVTGEFARRVYDRIFFNF